MAKRQTPRRRLLAKNRFLEVWMYMSNPFAYAADGTAQVEWLRINQTTWNAGVGMFAVAPNPFATWRNLVTSLRFVNNETIIGTGCPLALLASENRVTAQDFLTAAAAPFGLNPTFHGIGWWPGQQFGLLGGIQVCGAPFPATDTVTMQLTNVGVPGDDEIDRIGLIMVEIPQDKGAENYKQLAETWELLERGYGGISFATHTLPAPAGGAANIEDELLLQTWHHA